MNRPVLSNITNAPKEANAPKAKKTHAEKLPKYVRTGRWERHERIAFLQGFRVHGKGNWKEIGKFIPYRTTIQVKTHAQHVLRLVNEGLDPFKELDDFNADNPALPKITHVAKPPSMSRKNSYEIKAAFALLALKKMKNKK